MKDSSSYTGAGINACNMNLALSNAINHPSKDTLPAGATWPFVRLSVDSDRIDFYMSHLHKTAHKGHVKITLNKVGYVCFDTGKDDAGFGFLPNRIQQFLLDLKSYGYILDVSCKQNLKSAQINSFLLTTIPILIFLIVTYYALFGN